MKHLHFSILLAALLCVASCKPEEVRPTSVSVTPSSATVTEGETANFTASVLPAEAVYSGISWSSSDNKIATVNNGVVTGVSAGSATITASADGVSGKATVTVTAKIIAVTGVNLNKEELYLIEGDDAQLTATVAPENATDKSVSWKSSDEKVATVSSEGKVTAVKAGTATITVTTEDGGKTATCAVTVKAALPEGALPGVFSVSATKKVHFSQGNLYYDGSAFNFETNQHEFPSTWNTSHVGHFFWSKTASVAYAENYSDASASEDDVFFTNATAETAKSDFTVNGVTGQYRTLSKDEWVYMFNTASRMKNSKPCYSNATSGITIESQTYKGVFLYPDDYNGYDVSNSSMTWEQINAAGIVFLPAAGFRLGSNVDYVGVYGNYWSSSAYVSDLAYYVYFYSSGVRPGNAESRLLGHSVRLITECQ